MLSATENISEAGLAAAEPTGVHYPNREAWLQAAVELIRPIFSARGYTAPPVHISIGWPGSGQRSRVVGECWASKASTDGINQIFLVPSISDPVDVLDTLTHELVHAVDDCEHSHGREFRKIALSVGLQGPRMRHASAGEALRMRLQQIAGQLGPFPHAALTRRPPRTRNPNPPRAKCPQCGYRLAIPREFLHLGPPICPEHKEPWKRAVSGRGGDCPRTALAASRSPATNSFPDLLENVVGRRGGVHAVGISR